VREVPVKLNKVTTVSQRESLKLAFANHAKALTEIEHESLLHVHDYFSEIDRQYLVTEAVEGDIMSDLIARNGKGFSVAEVTIWADELLDALNYLHTRKPAIVHRNINPSNLKLHPSGKIKLVGVGVDSSTGADSAASAPTESSNLRYSSMEHIWPGLDPASQKAITNSYDDRSERILKQPLDERSDIYALGATLYYLITGVEPVDPIERSIEILDGKMDPLREPSNVDPQIPSEISDVLMKALEIKRENRFDAAVIMRQVLKTAITRVRERGDGSIPELRDAAEQTPVTLESEADTAAALAVQQQLDAEIEQTRQKELIERQLREAEEQRQLREAEEQRQLREAEEQRQLREAEEQRQLREAEEQRQLREAEEQRQRADLAAAEAAQVEMLRVETEMAGRAADELAKAVRPEENILDGTAEATEVVAYRDTADIDEDELAAVLNQLEEAESAVNGASLPKNLGTENDVDAEGVTDYDAPADLGPQPVIASNADTDVEDIFTVHEPSGSRLPMPAIAGGVGLVIAIAIGGWFAMSGSSEIKKPEPAPAAAIQVAQPTPAEPNPDTEVIASTQSTDTAAQTPESATEQTTAVTKPGPAAKAKKAEPAKAAPAKKKVTVDDLINDN